MCKSAVREKGLILLDQGQFNTKSEIQIKDWLIAYQFDNSFSDDSYSWLSCVLALIGSSKGNFGIGCVLVDNAGSIVEVGHNEVFHPYFRSDRHGEMVVINAFEEKFKGKKSLKKYTLYSSLESCPMCLTRLITSGIGKVSYLTPDLTGGMVNKIDKLPEVWQQLSSDQIFNQASCSKELMNVSSDIFLLNVETLNTIIRNR